MEEDLVKGAGPNREYILAVVPANLQHDFDKYDLCKKCGALSFTKGKLCTGQLSQK